MQNTGAPSEPIRIAQVIGKWKGGGVESVVMNYYRHIDRTQVQFDFIVDQDSTFVPQEEIESLGGRIFFVPPYQHLPAYLRALQKIFRENHYRIVHSHINTLSVFPLYAAKKSGVRVRIAHSHSTTSPHEPLRNLVKNILKHFSRKYATDYFACSELAGRYQFGNKTFDQGKVTIIRNAIDLDKFKFEEKHRKEIRKELHIPDDALAIGHIGRFVKTKNHTFLIDVFAEVHKEKPNSYLILAGDGPLMPEIQQKIKNLNIENSVFFLGQRSDTHRLYSAMDVFCLPSLYEGLPVVGVEAQAAGCPCLFSDKITKEAVLSNTKQLPISDKSLWAKEILRAKKTTNNTTVDYDIKTESKKLANIYLQKNKIKIMHLISTSVFSGAENVACQIINGFKDRIEYSMTYAAVIGKNIDQLNDRKIPILQLKKFNYSSIKAAIKKYNPDVIHAHDPKAIALAAIASNKIKIIGHFHVNEMNKITPKSIIVYILSSKISKMIWVSNSALNEFCFKKKIEKKSTVLYNTINSEEIEEKAKDQKIKYKKYDIVYLGRLTYQKNPQRLIQIINLIAKKMPNVSVAIIGDGDLFKETFSMIQHKHLDKNIKMFGNLNNPYPLLNASKILLMTSRNEGTPMCILEAMALRKPIISTPTDGIKDIVIDGQTGILSNNNQILADSVLKLLSNNNLYEKMSKDIFRNNSSINNYSNYISSIESFYRELA